MARVILLIGCIVFLLSAYVNSKENEILENKVRQSEIQLEQYKERIDRCLDLAQKGARISELCFPVTEALDRLDSNVYDSEYLGSVRQKKAKPEDMINGYLSLIERVEADLQKKSNHSLQADRANSSVDFQD